MVSHQPDPDTVIKDVRRKKIIEFHCSKNYNCDDDRDSILL